MEVHMATISVNDLQKLGASADQIKAFLKKFQKSSIEMSVDVAISAPEIFGHTWSHEDLVSFYSFIISDAQAYNEEIKKINEKYFSEMKTINDIYSSAIQFASQIYDSAIKSAEEDYISAINSARKSTQNHKSMVNAAWADYERKSKLAREIFHAAIKSHAQICDLAIKSVKERYLSEKSEAQEVLNRAKARAFALAYIVQYNAESEEERITSL
jgi:hypothetical protein